MNAALPATHIAFGLIATLLVISSALVVLVRNLFRAALALGAALICVAALFLLLGAEFLGWVHILVYVGAVLTLILFAVMLTAGFGDPSVPQSHATRWPAALAVGLLFGLLRQAIQTLPWESSAPAEGLAGAQGIGRALVTTYVLPFEMISVLFVAVMVGALVLAGRRTR